MSSILLIDDSPSERHVMTGWLKGAGYDVIEAADGQQGLGLAEQREPDLILLDIVMPGMSGYEAARHLRKKDKTKDIPVIIVSTKGEKADIAWGKRQGAVEYLSKPVTKDSLLQAVKTWL